MRKSESCRWFPVCPMRAYTESGRLDPVWMRDYCHGDFGRCVRFRMEEEGRPHPDWMLPDGSLDERLKSE